MERRVIDYAPRPQFRPYHNRSHRFAIGVAHRRAGKTVATINDLIKATITNPRDEPRSAFITPLFNQAKDIAWTYLKRYAEPLLASRPNESELYVELINGGRIRLYGADNPDRLRGIYLDDVVLDENADMHPAVWPEVIRPALADRAGRATFIGTPKGHNGFHKLWERAQADPDWFTFCLRASETNIIPAGELEAARRSMSEDQYQQEFECSFEAALKGAYFAQSITKAREEGRIGKVQPDPMMEIRTYWDLGVADSMAIWVAQFIGREIRVIDYIEGQGQPLAYYVRELRSRDYEGCRCILPHDGARRDSITAVRFEDHLKDAGFKVETVANQGKGAAMTRIEAARRIFNRIWFDEERTRYGLEALAAYHERLDEKREVGLGPEHDWASHAADAFGLMAIAYAPPKPVVKQIERVFTTQVEDRNDGWLGR